jgi:hypothetical protein
MTEAKQKVRVQAGREGGPMAEFSPPAATAPTNLPVPAGPEPTNMLAVIARAAADPRTDVAKMQALLSMQKDIMADDSKRAFNLAFIALQNDLPSVGRDGKIEIRQKDAQGNRENGRVQQSTPYATFNNIMKTIKPLLNRHGFALSFSTEPAGDRILVKGLLEGHGHERSTAFPLPAETSGSKNNVQGWGSSMSYGKRYCTIALLNIVSDAAEDADTDGHAGNFKPAKGGGMAEAPPEVDKVSDEQAISLRDEIEAADVPIKKFLDHYDIVKVADLPANLFEAAKKGCRDYAANREAARRHG